MQNLMRRVFSVLTLHKSLIPDDEWHEHVLSEGDEDPVKNEIKMYFLNLHFNLESTFDIR